MAQDQTADAVESVLVLARDKAGLLEKQPRHLAVLKLAAQSMFDTLASNALGMLVVDQIQPGSPAFSQLQIGDILISVDGRSITTFEPLEELLDDSIGKRLRLTVQRGGAARSMEVEVSDLEAISPAS